MNTIRQIELELKDLNEQIEYKKSLLYDKIGKLCKQQPNNTIEIDRSYYIRSNDCIPTSIEWSDKHQMCLLNDESKEYQVEISVLSIDDLDEVINRFKIKKK